MYIYSDIPGGDYGPDHFFIAASIDLCWRLRSNNIAGYWNCRPIHLENTRILRHAGIKSYAEISPHRFHTYNHRSLYEIGWGTC